MKHYLVKLVLCGTIAIIGIGCANKPMLPQPILISKSPAINTSKIEQQIVSLISNEVAAADQIEENGPRGDAVATETGSTPMSGKAVLLVDANQQINPFSNEMLGVALSNWEHSWGKLFPGDVPGLANILREANIGLVRYAGGLWSNRVGWERIPQRRPGDWIPNPDNYHPNFQDEIDLYTYRYHYGQDEIDSLAKLSQDSGVEVMVQLNVSNNDPEMWADMAHYTNIENDYGFKYWELGNEFDLKCLDNSDVCVDPESYQNRAAEYINALVNVDSSLSVIGGVSASGHAFFGADDYSGNTTEMSPWLYKARDAGVHSLSYHWYSACNLEPQELDSVLTYSWGVPYTAWQNTYSRSWSKIGPERVEAEIIKPGGMNQTQGISELNIDACNFERAPVNSNHLNSVWMADVIGRLGYNGLDYMTWYTGFGTENQGYTALATVEDFHDWGDGPVGGPIYLRPSYYTLFLLGNFFGDQYVRSMSPDEEKLSIWASTDGQDLGTLKIIVVNISDSKVTAPIAINGFSPMSGKKYLLSNADPLNMDESSNGPNHGTTINGLTLTPDNIAGAAAELEAKAPTVSLTANQVTEEYPPFSVTAIVLNGESKPPAAQVWLPALISK